MITQDIYDRDVSFMTEIASKYALAYSLAEIMEMSSIHINFSEWTFRLFGSIREKVEDESPKFKQVAIYHYSIKMVNKAYQQEEIYKVREDFIKFTLCFNQVKSIKEIEVIEDQMENTAGLAKVSTIKTLKK